MKVTEDALVEGRGIGIEVFFRRAFLAKFYFTLCFFFSDVPEYDSIFKDSDAEGEDDDDGSGREDRSGGEDDDNAEDVDSAEGSNVTAKRSRFDAKSILKRRERRLWEEKRSKILFEYQQFSHYGSSTALLMYDLAWKMSRDTNDLLWWAIVGHTEQFLLLKSEAEKYLVGVASIRDHVARFNNSGGAGSSGGDNESSQQQSVDCTKISFQKELNLNLYRHWSIFESVCHTVYTSGKFKIWSLKGKQRLSEFLAESGLPLSQCRQRFASMDLTLRNNIVSLFEEKADKYGLDDITFGTFCASTGYRSRFSAPDVFFATLSLMEHCRGGGDSLSNSAAAVDAFLEALDSLSRPKVELLERGIGRAKELLGLVFKQVQNFLDMRLVVSAGPFLYAIMQDETNRADLRLFSQPNCLMLLAQYTLRAHAAVTGSKKVQSLPLVVSAPLDVAQGTCLVLGVPPVNDRSRRNLLGKAFEQAARKTSSRYLLDYFDASVIQLKTEDRSKFFDGLISLLT